MFIEHLGHAKNCARLAIQRGIDPVLFSIIHSLVNETPIHRKLKTTWVLMGGEWKGYCKSKEGP